GDTSTDPQVYAVVVPVRQRCHQGEVKQCLGPSAVEVEIHHYIRAAEDRQCVGSLRLGSERVIPGDRLQEIHAHHQASPGMGASSRHTVPSINPYGRSAATKTSFGLSRPNGAKSTSK